jgi:uncharacterized membrane protein YbhN (UPF0104 family)
LVSRGLGIQLPLGGALAVYFFSLAFSLIFPLPVDIGVLEVSGVGAFLAQGVHKPPAVGAVLINRVLSFGSALAIAVAGMLILHDELRQAMRELPRTATEPRVSTSDAHTSELEKTQRWEAHA